MSNNRRDFLLSAFLLGKSATSCPDILQGNILASRLLIFPRVQPFSRILAFCCCPSLADRLQQVLAQVAAGPTWLRQIKCSYGVLHLDHVYEDTMKLKFLRKKCFSSFFPQS